MRISDKLAKWRTLIFDCDGVLLNSNQVKTNAFYEVALPYGNIAANALKDYHLTHGGISRFRKFEYFLKIIMGISNPTSAELQSLLQRYAELIWDGLLTCDQAVGLDKLRITTPDARWMVISGSDQDELRQVLELRGMAQWFDGGIYGSPQNKEQILERELSTGRVIQPGVFFGDSRYDEIVALHAGLEFVFVSDWSEVPDMLHTAQNAIPSLSSLLD